MSTFDTVLFRCPVCDNHIEHQTKYGKCQQRYYNSKHVPAVIAINIHKELAECENCGNSFEIDMDNRMSNVSMSLI